MFKSKMRPIIIPQYEHSRLAGTLAAMWGNDDFEKPVIDFIPFVRGVTLHDWHYGVVDNLPIGATNEADWLAMVQKGVEYWFDDPITDIVTKLHIKRLLSRQKILNTEELINRLESRIEERLSQTDFSHQQFEWADKITQFCDQLAFDFSFEKPSRDTWTVYTQENSSQETTISYEIKSGGKIEVAPWPFSADRFSGIIIGYQQTSFPTTLTPEVIHFQISKHA